MSSQEERLSYETIKWRALSTYYDGCRDHALMKGWPHEQIMGYVDHQFENTFGRPIEQLMFKVVELVLSGGWHRSIDPTIRKEIAELLTKHGLENLLANVPTDEVEAFKHDLKILKLIPE
jgi:hypothetical protein